MCRKLYAVVDTKDEFYYSFAFNDWFDDLTYEGCLTPNKTKAENVLLNNKRYKLCSYELKQVG